MECASPSAYAARRRLALTLLHPRIGFHVASVHSIFDLSLTRNNFSQTIGQKLSKANLFQITEKS
jgi:hypothetical protein